MYHTKHIERLIEEYNSEFRIAQIIILIYITLKFITPYHLYLFNNTTLFLFSSNNDHFPHVIL